MFRLSLITLVALALGCSAGSDVSPQLNPPTVDVATNSTEEDCLTTATRGSARPIPGNQWRDSFPPNGAWFMSTPKSTWTVGTLDDQLWFAAQPGYWTGNGQSHKAVWLKPVESTLQVTGKRLDGDGRLTSYSSSSGGYPGDFEASGLTFSDSGCWAIEARAGDASLHFTIWVKPPAS
jgi:hypothetical protein